ncbi:MAG: hypothetical protein IKN12_04860, partial [Selenomonadaceae bacterium]|nr:hypothetical protein [Selenomonadaceae bacterium]
NFIPTLIQGLQKASELSEYGTRIAVYNKRKNDYKKAGMDAEDAMLAAALRSRDLIDFGRHGKTGRKLNKMAAFANASIQGMDKFYREVMDPKGWKDDARDNKGFPKEHARTLGRLAILAIIPALLSGFLWRDKDWYKDIPNWLKNTHWVLPITEDVLVRIPKGADVGIRFFSSAVQNMMDYRTHAKAEYFAPILEAAPSVLPTIMLPMLEATSNYSFFTKHEIVPHYQLENEAPKRQYGAYTTGFAKFLGEKLDVSPRIIEHIISGYTGSIGMAIPKALDIMSGEQQLSTSVEDLPIFRSLLYPSRKSSQTVQDFYDEMDKQTKLKNEYKATKKRPEGFDPAMMKRLEATRKKLSALNKKENAAIVNPSMSYDERKKIQRDIARQRNELARKALGRK